MDGQETGTRAGATLSVHNPVGYPPKIARRPHAKRLDRLDGKIVYLVDCRFDDSIELLKQVAAWFASHRPDVVTRMISLTNYYGKNDPETWKIIQANGDAAIVGVGH